MELLELPSFPVLSFHCVVRVCIGFAFGAALDVLDFSDNLELKRAFNWKTWANGSWSVHDLYKENGFIVVKTWLLYATVHGCLFPPLFVQHSLRLSGPGCVCVRAIGWGSVSFHYFGW